MDLDLAKADPERLRKGYQIWKEGGVNRLTPRHWIVRTPGAVEPWNVDLTDDGTFTCDCPDFQRRHTRISGICKHIAAVLTWNANRDDVKPDSMEGAGSQDS